MAATSSFDVVWIPEFVLSEVKSENTLAWMSEALAGGRMSLMPDLPEYREAAFRLMEASRRYKRLDYPEAYCIAVAAAYPQAQPLVKQPRGHGGRRLATYRSPLCGDAIAINIMDGVYT